MGPVPSINLSTRAASDELRQLRALERRLSDLVIQAYRLDDADIDLLWRTAPPRMPWQ